VCLLLAALAATAFGASGAVASSQRAGGPVSVESTHRSRAAPETRRECLNRLRRLVREVAKLDRIADDVRDGRAYLYWVGNVVSPLDKGAVEAYISMRTLLLDWSPADEARVRRNAEEGTRANLRRLSRELEEVHERIRKLEKRCDELKSGTTPTPAAGLELTISLGGAALTRDLKTGEATPPAHAPGATARLQSGETHSGTVKVTGTLPAGYTVYVAFHGRVWVDLGPGGGAFSEITEAKGFGAANDVGAYACTPGAKKGDPLPSNCFGQGGAVIDIVWSP
jgi:hypothetical protein